MKLKLRSLALAITGALAILVLAGCAFTQPPTEGQVLSKNFTPAYTETYTVEVQSYDYGCHNKNVYDYNTGEYEYIHTCEYYHGYHGKREERQRYHEDKWTVLFEGENSDGEIESRTVDVPEPIFDKASKGYSLEIVDDTVFIEAR